MAKAVSTKYRRLAGRKLSPDQIFDLWVAVEEALESADPQAWRDGLYAADLLLGDIERGWLQ